MRVSRPLRAALLLAGLAAAGAASAYRPIVDFQLNCQGCHLADGAGEAGRVPSMRRTLALFSLTAAGRNYVIRVPGVAESPLSDAATAALLNWMVRHLSDVPVPRDFVEYTAAEVARSRRDPLADPAGARARLLCGAGLTAPSGRAQSPRAAPTDRRCGSRAAGSAAR